VTVTVSDLGLELRGVPRAYLDAAQLMLDEHGWPPILVRHKLRLLCPDQPLAEEIAQATLRAHHHSARGFIEAEACLTCYRPWPCPDVQAANRTLWIGDGRVPR